MRLNFSGSTEGEIREGIRRIGRVVSEQLELFESITGEHRIPAIEEPELGDVLPFPPREP
jgi:2-aminoadipate transaminase